MKTSTILNVVLALALAFACGRLVINNNSSEKTTNNTDMEEAVYNNIMTRSSVRSYLDKPVEREKVEKLLRAGMAAPSAVDKRPWHFTVVTDKEQLSKIAELTPNAGMAAKAPLAIVVSGDLDKALEGEAKEYWIQDVSAATENILLAAHGMGLGAVWTGIYPISERVEKITGLLEMPSSQVPFATIVIGYPDGENQPKDKFSAENVSYDFFSQSEPSDEALGAPADAAAQSAAQSSDESENKSFHDVDITKDFGDNPFNYFMKNHGLILAAGDKNGVNAMTIGWGGLGRLWQKYVATVYVAKGRYTFGFMEKTKYFTIMEFKDPEIAKYMGSHSGRDGDKAKALNLHVAYTDNGAPYYEEADAVIECRLMYKAPFDPANFTDDVPVKFYDGFEPGYHSEYIGEVVRMMKK